MAAAVGPGSPATAGAAPVVALPTVRGALRQAGVDFYFNSWRLAPANLLWAAVVVLVLVIAPAWPPAVLLLAALGLPIAGIHRMAARIARGDGVSFGDFVDGARSFAGASTATVAIAALVALVLASNVAIGLGFDNPFGWFLAATAVYALVALWMFLLAFWPILVDPAREDLPLRRRIALAGLVIVARPGRMLLLAVMIGLILAAGVVILAGIALVGVAYAALAATRFVLPIADRIEAARS